MDSYTLQQPIEEPWSRERRLKFAITFAQDKLYGCSLDVFKPGQWMTLREDIAEFLGLRGGLSYAPGDVSLIISSSKDLKREFSSIKDEQLRDLQARMKSLLDAFVSGYEASVSGEGAHLAEFPISATYRPWQRPDRKGAFILMKGSIRDCALALLMDMLKGNTQQIRRCPECQDIFYRHRKQIFCGTQCMNRAMAKRFRAKQMAKVAKTKVKKRVTSDGRKHKRKN